MALTIRLPEGLHFIASRMADDHGISLNALVKVALAEYLQRHERPIRREAVEVPVKQPEARPQGVAGGVVTNRDMRRLLEQKNRKRRPK